MKIIKIILFTTLIFSLIVGNSNKVKNLEVKRAEQEKNSYLEANVITANSFLSVFGERKKYKNCLL